MAGPGGKAGWCSGSEVTGQWGAGGGWHPEPQLVSGGQNWTLMTPLSGREAWGLAKSHEMTVRQSNTFFSDLSACHTQNVKRIPSRTPGITSCAHGAFSPSLHTRTFCCTTADATTLRP